MWDLVQYEACRREPNLTLLLNTFVYAVERTEAGRIAAVLGTQSGTEKRLRIAAALFVDATGDGAVGVPAGVPWRTGQEARAEYGESFAPAEPQAWTLGSSLLFRARDVGRPVAFTPPEWAERYPDEDSLQHRSHSTFDGGYWWIEIGAPFDTLAQNEEIRDELLRHVLGVWDHIKNHCTLPGVCERAASYALDWIGMLPAKRESRRYIGAHVMTQGEVARRERYPDRVAYGGWIIDDHTQGGILARDKKPSFDDAAETHFLVAPYSVPLRSLYAPQVENLLFIGRLMSASRLVFNSLRVQRTLAVVGQAAGTAAAACARLGIGPAALSPEDVSGIQQSLLRQDCSIPFLPNADPDDLARAARVTASSTAPWPAEAAADGLSLATPLAQLVPVTADYIKGAVLFLENRSGQPAPVRLSLHPAADVWDLSGLQRAPLAEASAKAPAYPGWNAFTLNAAVEPGHLYWLRAEAGPEVVWRMSAATVPGATAARLQPEGWRCAPGIFQTWRHLAAWLSPNTEPLGPENVTNGVARPEAWPNLWISDPAQPLPQWLCLDLPRPARIGAIHLTLDTDIARTYMQRPAFFRAPECARDFRVEVRSAGEWHTVAQVRGNYHRHQVLRFAPLLGNAVRVTIEATNGAPSARVYAVRIYGASTKSPASLTT